MSLAALLWAAILAWAAAHKIGGMPGSMMRAMRDLNLPSPLMRPLVAWAHLAVQIALALGLALAPRPLSWIFTASGALLAAVYLMIIATARGFVCRCVDDEPRRITGATVLRNIGALALALLSLGGEGVWGLSARDWPALLPFAGFIAAEAASARSGRI